MEVNAEAKLLRIFIGESDKFHSTPLYEHIVTEARKKGLAGATVFKGVMGFGAASRIHSSKILRLSEDLPLLIEIADDYKKIENFIHWLNELFDSVNCGALITIERVEIIKYRSR